MSPAPPDELDDAASVPDDPVSVEFELTPEEWVEVSLQHSSKQPQVLRAMRNVRLLFFALIVLAAAISLLDGAGTAALIWLLAGSVVLALMGPILRGARRKQFREYAETGIANGMFGHHRVELRPEGMLDSTEGYEWLTRWSAIDRVEEGEGAFLIYTGPNALLPVPHTAFRDSESLRSFSRAFFALREADGPGAVGEPGATRRLTEPGAGSQFEDPSSPPRRSVVDSPPAAGPENP